MFGSSLNQQFTTSSGAVMFETSKQATQRLLGELKVEEANLEAALNEHGLTMTTADQRSRKSMLVQIATHGLAVMIGRWSKK